MTWFHIEFRLVFADFEADDLESVFENVADCMADMDDMDADAAVNLEERTVEMSMSIQCERVEEAADRALTAVRAAVHAAGGSTPDWDKVIDHQAMEMRLSTELTPV